jgi:hypothetical protein
MSRVPFIVLLMAALLWLAPAAAAPVAVRYMEGVTHGFLVLRTLDGVLIASGDLLQDTRGAEVHSRMVFHFKDGSVWDETVVFTQARVFVMQSYRLLQRGPAFPEDTEISLERASGKYRVKTTSRKDARVELHEGTIVLPEDTYNGLVLTAAKNLPKGTSAIVHIVAFTPTARLVQLELAPAGEHKVLVGELTKSARHFIFKPRLGAWLTLISTIAGRAPPDSDAWIVVDELPAFVRFAGPLYSGGPAWRIELASPRWPDQPSSAATAD